MLCSAFLRSLQGFIPTGLRFCITAILPAFRMSLKKMLFRVLLFCPCGTNSSPKLCSSKLLLWCVVLLHVCPLARVFNQSNNCGSLLIHSE